MHSHKKSRTVDDVAEWCMGGVWGEEQQEEGLVEKTDILIVTVRCAISNSINRVSIVDYLIRVGSVTSYGKKTVILRALAIQILFCFQ